MISPHPNEAQAVAVGEVAPDFALADTPDRQPRLYRLAAAVGAGPIILVFYRGDW